MTAEFCYSCAEAHHPDSCPKRSAASLFDALVDAVPVESRFGGSTYETAFDAGRLTGQLRTVYSVISDSRWHTISEISAETGFSETSVSARLRDFRKPKFGGFEVLRRRVGDGGLHEYRLRGSVEVES